MNNSLNFISVALLGACLVSGCGAVGIANEPKLVSTSSFGICPWKFGESGLDIAHDAASWQMLLSQAKANAGDVRNWQPNFKDGQRVIIYRLGQKNSAGFAVSYTAPATMVGNKLRLPVVQTHPAPGTMQAMLITSPCAVGLLQATPGAALEMIDSANNTVLATGTL